MNGDPVLSLPLQATLFFPISGNPAGFNHFGAAEWLLRRNPAWERVVFVLSNGIHPDPTKPDAEAGRELRLELLTTAIAELGDEERSHLARLASRAGEALRVNPANLTVWTREFAFPRAVRTAETVQALREAHPQGEGRINWFAGSDLVARMADPLIFSDEDLACLASRCHYAILEREGHPLEDALQGLAAARGVSLDCRSFRAADMPPWLAPFLQLSSTHIRNATQAGDPLGAMLPAGAAGLIARHGLYRGAPDTGRAGREGPRSAWQLELERLQARLEALAGDLHERLARNHHGGRPHTFSLAEATVGGVLTQAFAGRSGASLFFRQARFAYDQRAKQALTGDDAGDLSAVSQEMAVALAQGMREQAGTDFALAETGMAGPPDGRRRSFKNGLCHLALVTPKGVHTDRIRLNSFLTRREHQLAFSIHALERMAEWLAADGF
jgi:PncC family amidohydrolase